MHNGTIIWNNLDLSTLGTPKFSIRRTPDPAPPGVATRMLVTLAVSLDLSALDPGTILARAETVAAALKTPEGILRAGPGSGLAVEWMAVPGENNVAEAMTGRTNRLDLVFTATEPYDNNAFGGLPVNSFLPAGAETPVYLHRVREESEEIKTTRHSDLASARATTTTEISFTARVAMANAEDAFSARMAYLRQKSAEVKALDTRHGNLTLNGISRIVRVTALRTTIDDRATALEISVQCSWVTLPDSGTAECKLEIQDAIEEGSGDEILSISGTITAETREIAQGKLEAIRLAQQQTAGRRITRFNTKEETLSGADVTTVGDSWPGLLSFTMEVTAARANGRMKMRVSTQKDIRGGMKWNYAGSVTAPSEASALALARAVASGAGHPVLVSTEETVERATDAFDHTRTNFAKVDFSYSFEGPSDGFVSGDITTEWNKPLAGEWTVSYNGALTAVSAAAAETRLGILLAAFDSTPPLTLSKRTTETYLDPDGTNQHPSATFQRLDFSATWRKPARTYTSVEYTDATENDYTTLSQSREISGTIYSDSRNHANSALDEFLSFMFGGSLPHRVSKRHSELMWGPTNNLSMARGSGSWGHCEFSASIRTALAGATGYDLMEASYTVERTGGLQNTVVTNIPFGRPAAQTNTGWLPGKITIQATAKALNLATAKDWVQAKRSLAPSGSGKYESDQPVETKTPEILPIQLAVSGWTFTGRYGWTYTTGCDGIW